MDVWAVDSRWKSIDFILSKKETQRPQRFFKKALRSFYIPN